MGGKILNKTCTKCNKTKPLSLFPKNRKYSGGVWCYCKECVSRDGAVYYKNNKTTKHNKIRSIIEQKYEYVNDIKTNPCTDCKNTYHPCAMEFDHLPQYKKKFNIGSGLRKYGMKLIKEEIAKCELVCANCHHIRTFKRFNNIPI